MRPVETLRDIAADCPRFCKNVLETLLVDKEFCEGPSSTGKHHYYACGNLQHTSEVVDIAMTQARLSNYHKGILIDNNRINLDVVFLASVLHDYGKIFAYEPDPQKLFHWKKTKDYTIQLHIEKSIVKARELLTGVIDDTQLEQVIHCIGAHHGKIEWGALWLPKSAEAWIVHLADMASVFTIANRPS